MTIVQIPVELGGSGTPYSDGTGPYGMASGAGGYGYTQYFFPMLNEVMAALLTRLNQAQQVAQDAGTAGATAGAAAGAEAGAAAAAPAVAQASASAELAGKWASQLVDPVAGGLYSARYYATAAGTAASNASTSEGNAAGSATLAANWAGQLVTPVAGGVYSARYYATAAGTAASNASTSEGNAAGSATLAANWAGQLVTPVAGGVYSARYYATAAGTAASNASTSEGNASTSATLAANWAGQLVTPVAVGVYSARYYANAAGTAASNASTSEGNASTSAGQASTQAGISTTQAGISTTKAGEAAASAAAAAVANAQSNGLALTGWAETSTTTGAGDVTLAGAITGFRPFSAVCADAEWVEYRIRVLDGSNLLTATYEHGWGLWRTGGTLVRVLVLDSSASGNGRISLPAGTKIVSLVRRLADGAAMHLPLQHGTGSTVVTAATLITWRPARPIMLSDLRASLATASSAGAVTLDLRVNGVSLLSTPLTIAAGSKTSVGGTPHVLADPDLTPEDEVTVVCTGAGTGAAGLVVTLIGRETPVAHMDGLSLRLTPEDMRPFHTRASKAWAFNAAGVLTEYQVNELRVVPSPAGVTSALREQQSTNKCTNFNANPVDLSGMSKSGDAAATLTVVDDSAALAAAGLSGVCTSGKVFKLDNTAGTTIAYAGVGGPTGNTNPHTVSAYLRNTGPANASIGGSAGSWSTAVPASATYRMVSSSGTPVSSAVGMYVAAPAGCVAFFVLNQLEEQPFATTPIVVAGAATTRARDEILVPATVAAAAAWTTSIDFTVAFPQAGETKLVGVVASGGIAPLSLMPARSVTSWDGVGSLGSANLYTFGTRGKAAFSADANGESLCLAGGNVATTSARSMPAFTGWRPGQLVSTGDLHGGQVYMHEFRTCRTRLNDNKLRRLTA